MPCLLLKKVSSTIKEVILYSFKWTQYSYEKSCERCKMEKQFLSTTKSTEVLTRKSLRANNSHLERIWWNSSRTF